MTLKKQTFNDKELSIYDDALIYKRGDYWHVRIWLNTEGKYVRKSLRTTSEGIAIERGKTTYLEVIANAQQGKKYFSLSAKEGVQLYILHREKDVESKLIVKGRLSTIKTHLEHWLDFIGRDTKLRELKRTDCEYYYNERVNKNKRVSASQITIQNEQSTINAMLLYLFKRHETYIDAFDFRKLPKVDKNNESIRRACFLDDEIKQFKEATLSYCDKQKNRLTDKEWLVRKVCCLYFMIASITGLRTGEQRQLEWGDIGLKGIFDRKKKKIQLIKIKVRAETSKVRNSREFYARDDSDYFIELLCDVYKVGFNPILNLYVFSVDGGTTMLSKRMLLYHFYKLLAFSEIKNIEVRGLVPYSFRHYFITNKIHNGATHLQVADMCGTSIAQIEKTYWHLNDEIRMKSAMIDYEDDHDYK